jgi:hypothetical protein
MRLVYAGIYPYIQSLFPYKEEVTGSNPQGPNKIFVGQPATFKVKLEIYRITNAL